MPDEINTNPVSAESEEAQEDINALRQIRLDKLNELCNIKSREELIADIVALLQAPARNVISALQNASGNTVAGLVKAIEEKKSNE